MVYTLCKYLDETEVVFSDIRKKDNGEEYIRVSFEKPTEHGFDTVVFELPSYKIIEREGNYSDEEVEEFQQIVERGANLFFKYANDIAEHIESVSGLLCPKTNKLICKTPLIKLLLVI